MNRITIRLGSCLFAYLIAGATPATALTGEDVLDKMSDKESTAYLTGSISMAAMIAGANKNVARRDCITDWYFKNHGLRQIFQALDRYKDRPAQPVIYALIKRACGE